MIIIIGYFCYLFPTSATDAYGTRLALAGKFLLAAPEDSDAASLVTWGAPCTSSFRRWTHRPTHPLIDLWTEPMPSGSVQTRVHERAEEPGVANVSLHTHSAQKGLTEACVTAGSEQRTTTNTAVWHPVGGLVTPIFLTRQESPLCVSALCRHGGLRPDSKAWQVRNTSTKYKQELAAIQGFISRLSQLCQLELVTEEELQNHHKRWRGWKHHLQHKQELQCLSRDLLVWEKACCNLLGHALHPGRAFRDC